MNLLYCDANGQVVSWHDSNQVSVDAGAYPTVVRIIPYDQPMGTLARVGEPPPPPWKPSMGDPRPYAQPTETPSLLISYAGQVRYDVSTSGINFNASSGTIPVICDGISQLLIGNLVQYASKLNPNTDIDFTQKGEHYQLKASECTPLFQAVNDIIQQARTIEAQCILDLRSDSPTIFTYSDVDVRFSGLSEKTLRKR